MSGGGDRYICPNCGREVKVGSKGCPHCQPAKPWEQDESYDGVGLDLPEDDCFDYDQFVRDEFGAARPKGKSLLWVITAILVLVALALSRFFF